jgi:hypothetical protein
LGRHWVGESKSCQHSMGNGLKSLFKYGLVSGSVLWIGLIGCKGPEAADNFSSSASQQSVGPTGSTTPGAPGSTTASPSGKFTVLPPLEQTTNLGTSVVVPLIISSDSVFNGTVKLSVRESDFATLDPGQGITFALASPTVTLAPNGMGTVNLTVHVSTMSPSFVSQSIHIDGVSADGSVTSSTTLPITVNAVFDIFMDGPVTAGKAAPENWSLAVGSDTKFISHTGGLLLRFNNMDGEVHLVHSSNGQNGLPVPHESLTVPYTGTKTIGLPASTDPLKTAGGIYMVTVAASTATSLAQVYCHQHEGGGESRTLQFNQPVVAVVSTTPIVNANATFTYINANILQPKCVACHSGTSPSGNVDLSSYSAVLNVVVKNNAAISPFLVSIENPNPQMPAGGTKAAPSPGSGTALSAALVQDVSDWINLGAQNN